MKKCLLTACTALSLSAGAAMAADISAPAVYDWSGFYTGIYGAGVSGDLNWDVVGGANGSFGVDGFRLGGLAGYNMQSDDIVFGVEGDIGFFDVDGSGAGGQIDDFDIEPEGRVRARLGMAMDNVMPFIAGGVSIGDADATLPIPGGGNDSQTHWGFNVGVGVDMAFSDTLIGRVEYIYDNYGSERYSYPGGDVDFDWDSNTVRAALIWNFGNL